jgi:hypothetical protein
MADEGESEEGTMAKWLILAIAMVGALGLVPILSKVKRTRGKKILYHVIFVGVVTLLLFLVPESFQDIVFSVRSGERRNVRTSQHRLVDHRKGST